ncbi:MAG: hypothetical protein ONB17_02545 [candidate division KSB1 bacterium]|nr:hypothetical protein [candidate division KSB1 bacterium]MDZ7295167.1 hypothetical protein [candidate division KSB1 bacterium]MDZ7384832.1 hypothetical protein [candidate division KSB1 bacterium]MDZ7393711.1 hypothetical protein [candidate division KSB1 bacterium]MDZ7412472.1 hypothetical protein [candidate division KSB1 bacterium]
MEIDIGKTIRISDFVHAADGRALLLDTTLPGSIGAVPGLEHTAEALAEVTDIVDGLIVNPGQAEHHAEFLGGRHRASPLVRVDWTNAFRGQDFCLPATEFRHLFISDAEDALALGASAAVASLFLGFDDEAEARNIEALSHLARECTRLALPLVVDIRPIGYKVGPSNFEESVKLGLSFMQELGADVLIIPPCSQGTCATIGGWIAVPVLVRMEEFPEAAHIDAFLAAGLRGFVLGEKVFARERYAERLEVLARQVHQRSSSDDARAR